MARPASNRALAALFALETDDFQSPAAITSTAALPPLNLDERVDLFLRAIYGSTHHFTASERAAARDRILDAMAGDLIGGADGGIRDRPVDMAASMIATSIARGDRRSQLLGFAVMLRDALLAPLMLPIFASPRMRLMAASLIALVVSGSAWSGTWLYAAHKAEVTIASWIDWEAKSGRVYDCGSRKVGGFPLRIEIRCADPKATLAFGQSTFVANAKELHAVASLLQPGTVTTEFTGPLSIAERGQSSTYLANWNIAQVTFRGPPATPERIAVVFGDLQFYKATQTNLEPIVSGERIELDLRTDPAAATGKPLFDVAAHVVGGSVPAGGPIASQPFVADVKGKLQDLANTTPKSLPLRLKEWQAAGRHFEITDARVQQGDAVATAMGTIGLTNSGQLDGALRVATTGPYVQLAQSYLANGQRRADERERIAQSLAPPRVQSRSIDNIQRTERELQREAAEREARLRAEREEQQSGASQRIGASALPPAPPAVPQQQNGLSVSVTPPASPTAPSLRPGGPFEVPIRFTDGAVYLGSVLLGVAPPLF